MKGDLLGYRFGGTEEAHLVPVREVADPDEAQRQRNWVKTHPQATDWALNAGKCVWCDKSDGGRMLTSVGYLG
jgi:hypothetical protein